jgi:hypothetical protein
MRNIRRVVAILGALASGGASCALLATGCGDDTGSMGGDAEMDGTSDATQEQPKTDGPAPDVARDSPAEARPDTTTADAPPDNTAADAPPDNTTSDAPPDNTTADAPADNAAEAAVDAGPDTADVGPDSEDATPDSQAEAAADADADAPVDAGPDTAAEFAFPSQLATALCQQIALCCFPDGGTSTFDMNACAMTSAGTGFDNSSYGTFALSNGNIAFDPDAGAACLSAINSIAGTCTVTAAIQQQIIPNCFGAFTGTLDAGASCIASMECAPGNACVPPTDGGTIGTCAALRDAGAPCGDIGTSNYSLGSEFCSYRGSGDTGLFCMETDNTGTTLPASSWTCQPQLSLTAMGLCFYDTDCVSPMVCDLFNTGNCLTTSRPLTTMTACTAFIDAGSD